MIEPIVEFFEKLITDFSWRRLLFILTILFLTVAVFSWYETYSGHFRLSRIDYSIKVLNQLTELSNKVKDTNNEEIEKIYKAITKDLELYVNNTHTAFDIPPSALKIIASAMPWVLMILGLLVSRSSNQNAIIAVIIASTPFVIASAYIPTFEKSYINYLVYPFTQFILLNLFVLWFQKRKRNRNNIISQKNAPQEPA